MPSLFSTIHRAILVLGVALAGCATESAEDEAESTGAAFTDAPGERVFADEKGFTFTRNDNAWVQRYAIVGDGLIFCETRGIVTGTIAEATKLLLGPWTWYGGALDDFEVQPDGHRTYRLWPSGRLGLVTVTEDMSPPERIDETGGVRFSIALDGFGSGPAYIELRPLDRTRFEIIGRWAGVRSNVLPTRFFAEKHLEAEGGRLGAPFFRSGGGFEGLKAALR